MYLGVFGMFFITSCYFNVCMRFSVTFCIYEHIQKYIFRTIWKQMFIEFPKSCFLSSLVQNKAGMVLFE